MPNATADCIVNRNYWYVFEEDLASGLIGGFRLQQDAELYVVVADYLGGNNRTRQVINGEAAKWLERAVDAPTQDPTSALVRLAQWWIERYGSATEDLRRDAVIEEFGVAIENVAQQFGGVFAEYHRIAEMDASLDGYSTEQIDGISSFLGDLRSIEPALPRSWTSALEAATYIMDVLELDPRPAEQWTIRKDENGLWTVREGERMFSDYYASHEDAWRALDRWRQQLSSLVDRGAKSLYQALADIPNINRCLERNK